MDYIVWQRSGVPFRVAVDPSGGALFRTHRANASVDHVLTLNTPEAFGYTDSEGRAVTVYLVKGA